MNYDITSCKFKMVENISKLYFRWLDGKIQEKNRCTNIHRKIALICSDSKICYSWLYSAVKYYGIVYKSIQIKYKMIKKKKNLGH